MRVLRGRTLDDALYEHHKSKDSSLLTFLCYTTMRHYYSLREKLWEISHRPFNQLDLEVRCLLLLGACQLQYSTLPAPLVVTHVVDAASKLGKTSAGALINAVLRKYDTTAQPKSDEAELELPQWMISRIVAEYESDAERVFRASVSRAHMAIRINTSRIELEDYCTLLDQLEIRFQKTPVKNSLTLPEPRPQSTLPGYEAGYFCVQDLASQLPVPLLEPKPEHRILDACSAPGVKLRQIADLFPENPVDAYDTRPRCSTWNMSDEGSLWRKISIKQGDLTTTSWWDHKPYDRILLDVPCSGSGTLSRHPDIKVTRSESDVARAAELQATLLNNLWNVLAVNGSLVYSTCSIFKEENDKIIAQFLTKHHNAVIYAFELPVGRPTEYGWQTVPKKYGFDGFYFARLKKMERNA